MNTVEAQWDEFLAASSDAGRLVLSKAAAVLSSWRTALVRYYAFCEDTAKDDVTVFVKTYNSKHSTYMKSIRRWYDAYLDQLDKDLKEYVVMEGFGAATSTPSAFDAACKGSCDNKIKESSEGDPSCWSLNWSVPFKYGPDAGKCTRGHDGPEGCNGEYSCGMPAPFNYSWCSGEPCTEANHWVLVRGFQTGAVQIKQTEMHVDGPSSSSSSMFQFCNMECTTADSNPSVESLSPVFGFVKEYAKNQAKANMLTTLAPLTYLAASTFKTSLEAGRPEVWSKKAETFKIGPISFATASTTKDLFESPFGHAWEDGFDLRPCEGGAECKSVAVDSDSCKDGVAGVSVLFGSKGTAWTKAIQAVFFYGPGEDKPQEKPCFKLGSDEVATAVGKTGSAYASYLPGDGSYRAVKIHYREYPEEVHGVEHAYSMVEIDFEFNR